LTKGTTKLVYHIGKFTFEIVHAPLKYPLVRDDLQTIDGLPVKEASRSSRGPRTLEEISPGSNEKFH
jgi:rare lipoprotein A